MRLLTTTKVLANFRDTANVLVCVYYTTLQNLQYIFTDLLGKKGSTGVCVVVVLDVYYIEIMSPETSVDLFN